MTRQEQPPEQDEDREMPPRGTPPEGPPEPNIPSVAAALPPQRGPPSERVNLDEVGGPAPDDAGPPDEPGNGNGRDNSG